MKIDLDGIFAKIQKDKEQQKSVNSKVLLVDGMNAYLRAFSVNPTMNDDGTHIGGITGFFNTINLAIRQQNPTRCIIIFDGKGGSLRRRKIYDKYKENRRGLRVRLNRTYDFADADDEHKEAMRQLMRIADYIDSLPLTMLIHDNIEADDVIGYLAQKIFTEQVVIMSTDKDFVQLVNDRVTIWNPPRKKLYTPELVKEDYEFMPKNYLYFRLIDGDKSDCIPGVKGIGIKTVQKNLPLICDNVDIEWEEFLDYLEKSRDNDTAKKLLEHKDILLRNYELMKLGEVQIDGSTKSTIREIIGQPISTTNKVKIKQLFIEDKLYGAIPNVDSWLMMNYNKLNAYAISTHKEK